jgi:2-polyprenyl-3-methyl-5-hydroxy-6-metoxy-1,4-benzoquinol methylase
MDISGLYEGDYVNSNYGETGILKTFNRINALDSVKSDNVGRVKRILEYASGHFFQKRENKQSHSVLDVGSGLCVFLYRMKEAGWDCTALDPDERCVKHAQDVVNVKAVCGNFAEARGLGHYDLITFNKVLEHVEDPVALLSFSFNHLKPKGLVYIEVPDGEMAAKDGKEREEFSIDHIHVFSTISLTIVAEKAGFIPVLIERLREPSTKYTLRAFLTVND